MSGLMYCTVAPVFNVPQIEEEVSFADGFVLATMPHWFSSDQWLGNHLSARHQEALKGCSHAFVAEYKADALGDPDPRWSRGEPKSKQDVKYEIAVLANLALWLAKPTPACFSHIFHAPNSGSGWSIQQCGSTSVLLCHSDDSDRQLTLQDIRFAAALHSELTKLHLGKSFWAPAVITWSALQIYSELVRYLLSWVALESLFGPDDARELSFRLGQRIAFFLGNDRAEAKQIAATVRDCYTLRSKVAHGRWIYKKENTQKMGQTEGLLRCSLVKVLQDPELIERFTGNSRETYLDGLVFDE